MLILSAEQVRVWDRYTMEKQHIPSIDLMETAAKACIEWLHSHRYIDQQQFYIFCGKGNNGGDGLAIARLLQQFDCQVEVYIMEYGKPGSADFQQNLNRLHTIPVPIHFIQEDTPLPSLPVNALIIDALLGTGLNRPATDRMARLIEHINEQLAAVISIDIPSGMFADSSSMPNPIIEAAITLSFQCYKPALLMAENAPYYGLIEILDIGLDPTYSSTIQPAAEFVEHSIVKGLLKHRLPHSHKGTFGHALLLAGSSGKMGAAVLAAEACLRSGAGLLSALIPAAENNILQSSLPECMTLPYTDDLPENLLNSVSHYRCIGAGPGLGQNQLAQDWLFHLMKSASIPMVLDADALNLLSKKAALLECIPAFSILTPHPKEFERLAGKAANDFERMEAAKRFAIQHQVILILKGHHSIIAMPGGSSWFNKTGNASMAKGGSGDVLTGMLTGLLARGYAPEQAALLGVYLHGLCGEIASRRLGMESVLASDLISSIGAAFLEL